MPGRRLLCAWPSFRHEAGAALKQIQAAVRAGLGSEAAEKLVSYHTPDGFIAEMRKFPPMEVAKPAAPTEPSERTTRGFKVRRHGVGLTAEERRAKEKAAVQMALQGDETKGMTVISA